MTKLITLEISEDTEKKIKAVMEREWWDTIDMDTDALNIVAQLYSDLTIGNKGKDNEDNY